MTDFSEILLGFLVAIQDIFTSETFPNSRYILNVFFIILLFHFLVQQYDHLNHLQNISNIQLMNY